MEGFTLYNFKISSIKFKENRNLTKNNLRIGMKNEFDPENKHIEDAITGDLLGDGHLSVGKYKEISRINARLEFTFSVSNIAYLRYLKFVVYADISTLSEPTP